MKQKKTKLTDLIHLGNLITVYPLTTAPEKELLYMIPNDSRQYTRAQLKEIGIVDVQDLNEK